MRSSWPLLCILACGVGCSKHNSKDKTVATPETPAPSDNPDPENPTGLTGSTAEAPTAGSTPDSPDGPVGGSPTDPAPSPPTEGVPGENPGETPTEPARPTKFSWSEEQFWVYSKAGTSLKFNSPWDTEEGDAIQKDYPSQPDFVKSCVDTAKKAFDDKVAIAETAASVEKILQAGATDKLILLVNVVEQSKDRDALRKLDRDAYFWNWPEPKARPFFAMSNFKKGAFVWEIIAAKDGCILPSDADFNRYFAYIEKRLTPTQGT